nr:MAG TPA: hypothetical protein [Caudoviricetes sp.]
MYRHTKKPPFSKEEAVFSRLFGLKLCELFTN